MRKNSFYISFGIWLIILPFFGIPGVWKSNLTSLSGLFLVLTALGPMILSKIQFKSGSKKDEPVSSPVPKEEAEI